MIYAHFYSIAHCPPYFLAWIETFWFHAAVQRNVFMHIYRSIMKAKMLTRAAICIENLRNFKAHLHLEIDSICLFPKQLIWLSIALSFFKYFHFVAADFIDGGNKFDLKMVSFPPSLKVTIYFTFKCNNYWDEKIGCITLI